jgi:hypothetical protein
MLPGGCPWELSGRKLQRKLKRSQTPSEAEGSAVPRTRTLPGNVFRQSAAEWRDLRFLFGSHAPSKVPAVGLTLCGRAEAEPLSPESVAASGAVWPLSLFLFCDFKNYLEFYRHPKGKAGYANDQTHRCFVVAEDIVKQV